MTVFHSKDISNKANIPFREFLMLQCLQLRRWSLLIAFFLYGIFAILDVMRFPIEIYQITLSSRFILVFLPLSILNFIYWFRPPRSIINYSWLLLLVYLGAGLNHSLIHYYSEINQLPFSQLGLVLIMMFGCLLTALPIIPALAVTIFILVVYGISNIYFEHNYIELFLELLILGSVAGLCLLINQVCQVILRENHHLIKKLYGDSITDGLTSLYNKRFFESQFEDLCLLAKRESKKVSLLLIDLDHFKKVNDDYGHLIGDECLKEMSRTLKSKFNRTMDTLARVGGEEFAALLPTLSYDQAMNLADKLRRQIELISIRYGENTVSLTASLGVSTLYPSEDNSVQDLFHRADLALYEAKRLGRNRVACAPVLDVMPSRAERAEHDTPSEMQRT